MLYPLSYEGNDCLLHSCSFFAVQRQIPVARITPHIQSPRYRPDSPCR